MRVSNVTGKNEPIKAELVEMEVQGAIVQSSLNVLSSAWMAPARATISLLKMFYAEYSAAQESIKRVASLLRGAKHMVSCGVVKPKLKSAALYF